MIIIVDYGMGNLASVYNAFIRLGAKARISSKASDIESARKVVLPGVGAFQDAMLELENRKLFGPIKNFIKKGKIFLGICLGLQLLFSYSEEGGNVEGFNILKGRVVRFPQNEGLKIPQIGWNRVKVKSQKSKVKMATQKPKLGNPLLRGIKDDSYFYFDHSYYAEPEDKGVIAATTDYGVKFASFICKDNIYAVQFHPEKSQDAGLKFLENFIGC